jgi:small-conductance mechanosensitive channel
MDLENREPDIKEFIQHLHLMLDYTNFQSSENKREYIFVHQELTRIEKSSEENSIDLANSILDSLETVEKEFRRQMGEEKSQTNQIKQQLSTLNQEKMKLDQSCLLLNTRTEEIENNVGVGLKLPSISKINKMLNKN